MYLRVVSRLTSTSVYLEDAQLTRLREVSSALRRPMAGLIREAIADWLSALERDRVVFDLEATAARRAALARDEGEEKVSQRPECDHALSAALFCTVCKSENGDSASLSSEGRLLNVNPD